MKQGQKTKGRNLKVQNKNYPSHNRTFKFEIIDNFKF